MSKNVKRKINGALRILAVLLELDEATTIDIQKKSGITNFYTVRGYIEALKEVGFIEEKYEPGPPAKYVIKLTEKGRKAAINAREILELAGLI